ncbi:MAG: polysaccharide biosynthesis tyrosine autokinase [Clostridia bacterium]|nr:polysaccharide biosynthesis tyrosine autokinase [Clostridia bacterium]
MENIDLKDIKNIIIEKRFVFISIILIALVAGTAFTIFTKPLYESSAVIQVDKNESSLTQFIKNNDIYADAAKDLGVETNFIKENTSITYTSATKTINITVKKENKTDSKRIADKLSEIIERKVEKTYGISAKVIQSAVESNKPTNVNYKKNLLFAFTIIVFASGIYILTILLMKSRLVNKAENLEEICTILGELPNTENKENEAIINDAKEPITNELLRKMITNISLNKNISNIKTLLITSANKNEGKSFIASNLAVCYAELGKKVLIVDTDIIEGKLNDIFNVDNVKGFTGLLIESSKNNISKSIIEASILETQYSNLHIIPSGRIENIDSYKLLMTGNLNNLINELKTMYDMVIFDSVSALDLNDSIIVSNSCDATVIVAEYDKTKIENVEKIKKNIEKVGGSILGIIINKTPNISNSKPLMEQLKKKIYSINKEK